MSKSFPWGRVLKLININLDDKEVQVTKYQDSTGAVRYHCEELRESWESIDALLISWIARKNLGLNQQALVAGVCKAFGVFK